MVRFEFRAVPNPARVAVPVRLLIGDVDVLGLGEDDPDLDPYLPLPLVKTAFEGLVALRQLRRHGRYLLELGPYGEADDLLFALLGGEAVVHSTLTERTARCPIGDLEAAWRAFAEAVRSAVADDLRAEADIAWWERWLHEDPVWLGDRRYYQAHWRERFDEHGWRPEASG